MMRRRIPAIEDWDQYSEEHTANADKLCAC
jgi:hypothetical protein